MLTSSYDERGTMPSLIAWLDSTPEEQKAARELIGLFDEQESRDELGIGPIRDAFSDLLFPGTSVLQTRARYFLFVPWCYTTSKAARLTGSAHRAAGRQQERQLIKALQSSSSTDKAGLVGARAGVNVQNLPSDIYWTGLRKYNIRAYGGGIGALSSGDSTIDGASELATRVAAEWNQTIPPAPGGFPAVVADGFALSHAEADWLRDRIVSTARGTVLAALLDQNEMISTKVVAPWDAVAEGDFEPLAHARLFSSAMHGASLLYNLLIAERSNMLGLERDEDPVEHYTTRVAAWASDVLGPLRTDLQSWDMSRMWELVQTINPNVHPQARAFVDAWIECLRRDTNPIKDERMRELVEIRERRKGTQSRLKNDKLLQAWTGASGTSALNYRWGNVRVIVNDIIRGLADAGA